MIQVEKPCVSLAACRANTGMNQKEFAKALDVDPGTIFNWEKNRTQPSLPALIRISELSGIPLSLIFIPENPKF